LASQASAKRSAEIIGRAGREVLALPIFPELREDEQQTVVDAIAEFLS
jgi:dTDP-4-amino-4,6-dideoxygalactose transaminase